MVSIVGSEFFDTTTQDRSAIELISWKSGEVLDQIRTDGAISWMCNEALRPKLLALLDQARIAEIDLETRSQKTLLNQPAIPISAFSDSKVLLALVGSDMKNPSSRTLGQLAILDIKTGDSTAILAKSLMLGAFTRFTKDGSAIVHSAYGMDSNSVVIERNLDPETARRRLSTPRNHSDRVIASKDSRAPSYLPKSIQVVPNKVSSVNQSSAPQSIDFDLLRKSIGQSVSVTFIVETAGGDTNLYLNSTTDVWRSE